jgi:hypothetical protein
MDEIVRIEKIPGAPGKATMGPFAQGNKVAAQKNVASGLLACPDAPEQRLGRFQNQILGRRPFAGALGTHADSSQDERSSRSR